MAPPNAQEVTAALIRVAIVDDHQLVLDGLTARLNAPDTGITVVASETTWGGLITNPEFPPEVVVLDLRLEDGIPVGTKIRALTAIGSVTVVISRHSDTASITTALHAGALGFVAKTESVDELVSAIRSAAVHQQHLSAPMQAALAEYNATPDPGLGRQELRALVLYAGGRSIKEVAYDMETTEETVKSYIKRGRRKYREVGVDVGTRILLRRHGIREGWLSPE
ncbi:LuxR family two component transcriptional regulator [Glaciihabitans tibetensis]|uniref:LuxR family two component transcriptional regulator n=1 Tax=Glaciihabitans tibetensis TaxID=1266600 RepID=A0A2T0VH44_9MICO|nr:response regulator transcription factor [Glaciihabitans tibetensis]PRY69534.1 LuxR family two component transcriptional regulator [Glaciihabitans tibetensis]